MDYGIWLPFCCSGALWLPYRRNQLQLRQALAAGTEAGAVAVMAHADVVRVRVCQAFLGEGPVWQSPPRLSLLLMRDFPALQPPHLSTSYGIPAFQLIHLPTHPSDLST